MKRTPRALAAHIIAEVLAGQSLSGLFEARAAVLPAEQRPLCRELVFGTLREWPALYGQLRQLLAKPLREKDRDVLALLAIGLYQLQHMRLPAHAAVSETVNTTQVLGKGWARGLTNGILRNAQRQRPDLEQALSAAERAALPDWLYEQFVAQWPAHIDAIASAARAHPPMHLRVNTSRSSRQAMLQRLSEVNLGARPHPEIETAIVLDHGVDVSLLPGFAEGVISVQDAAAQLAAFVVDAQPGDAVLDACAAPGGKTCHIAEWQPALHPLVAMDVSAERLERVAQNRDRIGLDVTLQTGDATAPPESLGHKGFDVILVDAPCSASGVLRRNPDVKVIRRPEDIAQFQHLQRQILQGVWPLLKPGGRLIYATCSLLQQENDDVIAWALQHLPHAAGTALTHPQATATTHGMQCIPSATLGDGLYYARLDKQPAT